MAVSGSNVNDIRQYSQGVNSYNRLERGILPVMGSGKDDAFVSTTVFGQAEDFGSGSFADSVDFDPAEYIKDESNALVYPAILSNASLRDPNQFNGVIEPLSIRRKISFTSTDYPDEAHDIFGGLQSGNADEFKASDIVTRFIELEVSGVAIPYNEPGKVTHTIGGSSAGFVNRAPNSNGVPELTAVGNPEGTRGANEGWNGFTDTDYLTGLQLDYEFAANDTPRLLVIKWEHKAGAPASGDFQYLIGRSNTSDGGLDVRLRNSSYDTLQVRPYRAGGFPSGPQAITHTRGNTYWTFMQFRDPTYGGSGNDWDWWKYIEDTTPKDTSGGTGLVLDVEWDANAHTIGSQGGALNTGAEDVIIHDIRLYDADPSAAAGDETYYEEIVLGTDDHTEDMVLWYTGLQPASDPTIVKYRSTKAVIEPFEDQDKTRLDKFGTLISDDDIINALNAMSPATDDLAPNDHKVANSGFTFRKNTLGTDSVAFGGLEK